MKEVKLIKFETQDILVSHLSDCFEIAHANTNPIHEIVGSHEYVPAFVDIERVRIERIIDHGVTHYIAVSEKVWEYLYLMENPVTAEVQQGKIEYLRDWKSKAMVTIEVSALQYKRIVTASIWTRIKWLFTGVS